MIHGTLIRTMLQHRDLDGVRLAHHGAVEGLAPFALVVALDVHLERVPQVDGVRERHVVINSHFMRLVVASRA